VQRQAKLGIGNTLQVSRKVKAMSGRRREGVAGGVERENPEEEKPKRGASVRSGNTARMATDSRTEQGPEGEVG
jgi:hypothetical protein